jgi:hypothetical protein
LVTVQHRPTNLFTRHCNFQVATRANVCIWWILTTAALPVWRAEAWAPAATPLQKSRPPSVTGTAGTAGIRQRQCGRPPLRPDCDRPSSPLPASERKRRIVSASLQVAEVRISRISGLAGRHSPVGWMIRYLAGKGDARTGTSVRRTAATAAQALARIFGVVRVIEEQITTLRPFNVRYTGDHRQIFRKRKAEMITCLSACYVTTRRQ